MLNSTTDRLLCRWRAALPAVVLTMILTMAAMACGSAEQPAAQQEPRATEPAAATAVVSEDKPAAPTEPAPAAMLAPAFELPAAGGDTISLASFAGDKNVVVVFYRGFW